MKTPHFDGFENGKRWSRRLNFTLAEWITSSGLFMVATSAVIAVVASDPLVLLPGISYAIVLGMAYMAYRYFKSVRTHAADQTFHMEVHPLSEAGWEDDLSDDTPEWVDMTSATFFKVVGTRGICPRGLTEGDFLRAGSDGSISPALCGEAEAVLRMASGVQLDVKQWCCPIYDHMLVFKKMDKVP